MSSLLGNREISSRPVRSCPRKTIAYKLHVVILTICIIQFLPIELKSYALPVLQGQDKPLEDQIDFQQQQPQPQQQQQQQQSNLFYPSSLQNNNAQQQPSARQSTPLPTQPTPIMTDSARRSSPVQSNQQQPNQILSSVSHSSPSSQNFQEQTNKRLLSSVPNFSTAQPNSSQFVSFNTKNNQQHSNNTVRTNSKNHASPNLDTFSEGSGNGPVPVSTKPKEKFDDTEEGDDDDDEDYDYKDSSIESGSGHGNEQSGPKKVELLGNNLVKKPTTNESDIYLPFRHPSSTLRPANHSSSITVSSNTMPVTDTSPLQANAESSGQTNRSSSSQNSDTRRPTRIEIEPSKIASTTVASTTMQNVLTESPKPTSSSIQKLSDEISRSTFDVVPATSTMSPLSLSDNQMRLPIPLTTYSPLSTTVKYPHNVSSPLLPRPSNSSKDSSEYLYEDENDDDDSEDSSIFDYNDSSENDTTNNRTLPATNATFASTMLNGRPPPTTPKPVASGAYTPTTVPPKPASPTTTVHPIIKSIVLNAIKNATTTSPSNTRYPPTEFGYESPFTTTTTRPPFKASTPSKNENFGDDEDLDADEEDKDEEEEDEDVEEEIYEEERNNSNGTTTTSSINRKPISSGGNSNGIQTNSPRQPSPSITSNNFDPTSLLGSSKFPQSVAPPFVAQTSSPASPSSNPTATSPTPVTSPPTTAIIFTTTTTTTTTPIPIVITGAPSTTSTSTTTTTTTTIAPSTTTTRWQTTFPPPFIPSTTTARTTSIKYESPPRNTLFPAITKTSDVTFFERGLHDDDSGLTKQIYDKAVEVYEATSKAIQAAADAVWNPAFELNSNTFEPLLTQPLLFMLVLGAAIIGLVLTMMLVVYIITYQIEPKDDISDDIY